MMEIIYFPGDNVINLIPHWADDNHEQLINRGAVGKIIESRNNIVTAQWTISNGQGADYTVLTERSTAYIELVA